MKRKRLGGRSVGARPTATRRDVLGWVIGAPFGTAACAQIVGLRDDYHLGEGTAAASGDAQTGGDGGASAAGNGSGGTGQGGAGGNGVGGSGVGGSASGHSGGGGGTGGSSNGVGGDTGVGGSSGSSGTIGDAGEMNAGASNVGDGGTGGSSVGGGGTNGGTSTMGGSNAGGIGGMAGTGGGAPIGGLEDNTPVSCTVPTPPDITSAVANTKLPDPFKLIGGTRITKKSEWMCLRAHLGALLQASIYGPKMPPPDELTTAWSTASKAITITMKVGSNTESFVAKITNGGTESSPVPGIITFKEASTTVTGVAKIELAAYDIAKESTTTPLDGLLYRLYGSAAAKSGSLIGWAWAVSRVIDAIEKTPESGVDPKHLGVNGCSRFAKGMLAAGAFDERVMLTVVQEGGTGGTGPWRIAQAEKTAGAAIEGSTESLGYTWQGGDFAQYETILDRLPTDQHAAIAMCAPRAVLVLGSDQEWVGPIAMFGGGKAAALVYGALGIGDRIAVRVVERGNLCQFQTTWQAAFDAFVNRFLKGGDDITSGFDTLAEPMGSKLKTFVQADWVDWAGTTLSGALAWDPFA